MKHIKRILALALVAVSLCAVAMPAMAGVSSLTTGKETDLARHNNIGYKTSFTAYVKMSNCPAGNYNIAFMYARTTSNSSSDRHFGNAGFRSIPSGTTVIISDTTQAGTTAKDVWLRLNPNGKTMTVDWTLYY